MNTCETCGQPLPKKTVKITKQHLFQAIEATNILLKKNWGDNFSEIGNFARSYISDQLGLGDEDAYIMPDNEIERHQYLEYLKANTKKRNETAEIEEKLIALDNQEQMDEMDYGFHHGLVFALEVLQKKPISEHQE